MEVRLVSHAATMELWSVKHLPDLISPLPQGGFVIRVRWLVPAVYDETYVKFAPVNVGVW